MNRETAEKIVDEVVGIDNLPDIVGVIEPCPKKWAGDCPPEDVSCRTCWIDAVMEAGK